MMGMIEMCIMGRADQVLCWNKLSLFIFHRGERKREREKKETRKAETVEISLTAHWVHHNLLTATMDYNYALRW